MCCERSTETIRRVLKLFSCFPRDEVRLPVRYFLVVLCDPYCAGGGLGRACAVPWPGVLYSFLVKKNLPLRGLYDL